MRVSSLSNSLEKISVALSKKNLREKIIEFLDRNPNPSDKQVHNWAKKNGFDVHRVEAVIYSLASDHIKKHIKG